MLPISQSPWVACKLGLQMNSSQQQFLNKEKGPQLKFQTPKRVRYLLHYFDQNSNSPPLGPQRAFGDFSKFKKEAHLTNICFSTVPIDFFAFSHGFQRKKFDFHSETTRTPFGLPTRNLNECRADFSKIRLLCFSKR
jgi:hypothetical protein